MSPKNVTLTISDDRLKHLKQLNVSRELNEYPLGKPYLFLLQLMCRGRLTDCFKRCGASIEVHVKAIYILQQLLHHRSRRENALFFKPYLNRFRHVNAL